MKFVQRYLFRSRMKRVYGRSAESVSRENGGNYAGLQKGIRAVEKGGLVGLRFKKRVGADFRE